MSKTVWINGTERLIEDKDRYGTYHLYVDDKDIKWLNSLQDWCVKAIQKASSNKKLNKRTLKGLRTFRHPHKTANIKQKI